ncbi:MAG: hypothetical protein IIY54_07310 [Ruminococcus sp.]|nr:hypothetical protein [Ruminococcus sp.]
MKRLFRPAIVLLTAAMLLCLSACAKPQDSQAATADEAIHAVEESDNVNGMRFDMTLLQFSQEFNKGKSADETASMMDIRKWQMNGKPETDENGVQVQYWYYEAGDISFTATVEVQSDKLMNVGCGTTMSHFMGMTNNQNNSDEVLDQAAQMAAAVCGLPADKTKTVRDIFYRTTTGSDDTYWYQGFVFSLSKKTDDEDNKNNMMLFRVFPVTEKLRDEWKLKEYDS